MHCVSRLAGVTVLLLMYSGCTPDRETPDGASTGNADSGAVSAAPTDVAGGLTAPDSVLRSAAVRVVDFLRGAAPYETLNVADTVELIIPAEGGGTRRRLGRDALRDREAWVIDANGQQYSFVPPPALTEMRVAPGSHLNCVPGRLADRVTDLATSPHVGVRLVPPGADSCLQGWNATFVFDTAGGEPRLTAAVYDQWEW